MKKFLTILLGFSLVMCFTLVAFAADMPMVGKEAPVILGHAPDVVAQSVTIIPKEAKAPTALDLVAFDSKAIMGSGSAAPYKEGIVSHKVRIPLDMKTGSGEMTPAKIRLGDEAAIRPISGSVYAIKKTDDSGRILVLASAAAVILTGK